MNDTALRIDSRINVKDRLKGKQLMHDRLIRSAAAGPPIAGLALCGALIMPLPASALDGPVLGGSGAGIGDYIEYNSRAKPAVPCDTAVTPFCTFPNDGPYPPPVATLDELLQGDAPPPDGNAGGNVELFANSENLTLAQYVAYNGVTTLSGSLDGVPVTLGSLTWDDWEVESYDCSVPTATASTGGLLDRWLTDLVTAYSIPLTPTEREDAITRMVCGNFLPQFSDPNIAYVNDANPGNDLAEPVVGLAGTFDLCSTLDNIFPGVLPLGYCLAPIGTPPTGRPPIQVSEIVKIQVGGVSAFLYNFEAVRSGQIEVSDPQLGGTDQQSHSGIYDPLIGPIVPKPPPPPPPPRPIPALPPFGPALLFFGLLIAATWARRRR